MQRYNQVAVNPLLRPDFTNTFELTHVFKEQNTIVYYSELSNLSGVGLNSADLFYSVRTKGKVLNVAGPDASYRNRRGSRTVMLSFSYRISRNAKDNKRLRDRNGARDEQYRVSF